MASRIVGIDLGSYSVKVAIVAPGFRSSRIVDVIERVIPRDADSHEAAAAHIVGEILRTRRLEQDTSYVAMAGDHMFVRILEFGFKNLRRADLERAVGAELEGILPLDLEDMAYAFETLPRDLGAGGVSAEGSLGDDDATDIQAVPHTFRGRVAAASDGMRVLACATAQERARGLLTQLNVAGTEPRGLIAVPAAYRRAAERIAACQNSRSPGEHAAIVDIGHSRTDVCVVVDGRAVFVRTISRGGRDLTQAIADTWKLPWEQAEEAKHRDGFIASQSLPARSEAWERIHSALEPQVAPLARELRQTLSACRAKSGATVGRVVLIGGGARVSGMAEYLSEQLRTPVTRPTEEDTAGLLGGQTTPSGVSSDVAWVATGIAVEGATGRPQFDLRKGGLAYKTDLSFLRAKAPQMIASALVVVAFAAGSAYASLVKLRKAETVLDERLALETTAEFNEQLDAYDVLDRIGPKDTSSKSKTPIPRMTAYDTLLALNDAMPDKSEVKIDVSNIDVKGDKITLRGTSFPTEKELALAGIDKLEERLKESKCFKEFTRGETQPGKDDSREFSLSIKSGCK